MSCPPGYKKRKGFTRKFSNNIIRSGYTVRRKGKLYTVHPTTNGVEIPATCVKIPTVTSGMGKLRKGDLIKYGYQYRLSDRLRHKALEKAIRVYGLLTVYHKLDAVAKLSVHHAPDAGLIFKKDRDWVHNKMKK